MPRDTVEPTARPSMIRDELRDFEGGLKYSVTAPAHWHFRTLESFGEATAVVAALSVLDNRGRSLMQRNQARTADAVTSVVEPFGAQASMVVIGGYALTGVLFHNSKAGLIASESAASSVIAAGLITPALKLAFGRARPRENKDVYAFRPFSGAASFPSGHTTQAFAVASVIARESASFWVKLSAYSIATGVGVSRMYHGAHYISDVAAAAMIGTTVGRSIAGHGIGVRSLRVRPATMSSGDPAVLVHLRGD